MKGITIESETQLTLPPEQTRRNPDLGVDLQPDLGRFVSTLAQAVDRGISREMAPHGLLPMDVHLLLVCLEKGECTATELSRLLPVEAARISQLVNRLVERGLIRRRRTRSDRRIVQLRLSPEGEDLALEVSRRMQDLYVGLTEGITERELQDFAAAAFRMIDNHEAMASS